MFSFSEFVREPGDSAATKDHFHEREGLREYIADRAGHNDRMELLEVDVQYERGRNLGHISYYIKRTADDVAPERPLVMGKGALECDEGLLWLLSMSHDRSFQDPPRLCPGRPRWPEIAVACSRGRRS